LARWNRKTLAFAMDTGGRRRIAAAALSIFLTFGAAIGLGVSSASPTWRDASVALALLSAIISLGFGGYIAGRARLRFEADEPDAVETRDGVHGLMAWALAVLFGAALAALNWGLEPDPSINRRRYTNRECGRAATQLRA
jgi:hypothetical protein